MFFELYILYFNDLYLPLSNLNAPQRLFWASFDLKCPWHEIFYYLIGKSFQSDEEWRSFYCDSTLGCRVIQDVNLCILDKCDVTTGTQWCKITKNRISLMTFSVYNWNSVQLLHSSQSFMKCPLLHFHGDRLGSRLSPFKVEKQSFPLQEVSFALVVHSVGVRQFWF